MERFFCYYEGREALRKIKPYKYEAMRAIRIGVVCFIAVITGNLSSFPASEAENTPIKQEAEEFDFANGLLSRGMYDMAVEAYGEFLKKYPVSQYAREARYGIAESFFLKKDNEKALNAFTGFLGEIPSGSLAADARLRIGQIRYALEDMKGARTILNEAINTEGSGEETVMAAEYYIAEILLREGKKKEAGKAFEVFLEKYPIGCIQVLLL